jgi:hypothetical protein
MNTLLNKRLAMYLEAEKVVMTGQSYTIGNRSLTRANLAEIRKAIDDLLAAGATLEGEIITGSRSKRVVFIG